jgi:prepilin-type processing-associated H-X9-DG protein/prepilin-type N-terminal cleavage/methylation domain-containing protein
MKKKPCINSGFTLIEMLVVFAVIAVLATLMVPAIGRWLEMGRSAACVGNLRQMGKAHMSFVADNDGFMIPAAKINRYRPDGPSVPYQFWFNALEPYMGSEGPASRATHGLNRPAWQCCPSKRMTITEDRMIGYGWNFHAFGMDTFNGDAVKDNRFSFSRLVSVAQPSKTILIGDSTDDVTDPGFRHMYVYRGNPETRAARHGGRGNYLMADGSVASYSPEDLAQNGNVGQRLYLRK